MAIRAEGPDYRTFRVHEVLEQSPAADAGLAEGDVITAIDNTPARDLTLSIVNEMFDKPVSYELTVRRGDQIVRVTLKPRPLV